MVAIDDDTAMVIGGSGIEIDDSRGRTFIYNLIEFVMTQEGPTLLTPRYVHASSVFTDSTTNLKYVVVAGGLIEDLEQQDSVEVLEWPSGQEWIQGKQVFASFSRISCINKSFVSY